MQDYSGLIPVSNTVFNLVSRPFVNWYQPPWLRSRWHIF